MLVIFAVGFTMLTPKIHANVFILRVT